MKNEKFGVLFDMDGVIINNNDWHVKSWMKFAAQLGIPLKEEEFSHRVFGKTNEEILIQAFPDSTKNQILSWSLEKEAIYREMYQPHFQLADGLYSFLTKLAEENYPMAVASNAPKVNVDFALDEGKIRHFFQTYLYFGLVAKPKPAPDIYIEAANLLGLKPQNCFVIEDSPTGLQAAVDAECQPIAICSTFDREELLTYTPHVFDTFQEIDQYIFNLS